jgi:formamidopyrimidine-DNA glycosylase
MPELPEVEITRRGLQPALLHKTLTGVAVRNPALRYPVPDSLGTTLAGQKLLHIDRRGKYLLLGFGGGTVLIHLGMSGSLRLLPARVAAGVHEHVDLLFGRTALRLSDPRRFGAILFHGGDIASHPLIANLGVEPLSPEFSPAWMHQALRGRRAPVKQVLMDSHTVVGIGNIYASESLFHAGIRPLTPACALGPRRCARLVAAVRNTLAAALGAGGSSIRDYVHSEGDGGRFQQEHCVYDRAGEPCRICLAPIRAVRLGNRSTFYCPRCQR